jgi:hypothetical protein
MICQLTFHRGYRIISNARPEILAYCNSSCHTIEMQGLAAVVLCVLAARFAPSAQAAIAVVSGSSPVRVTAKLGDDASFAGGVELMSDVAVPDLLVRSDDLVRADGQARIGRQQVALVVSGKLTLDASTPRYVGIKLTGVKEPGRYTGNLYFYLPGSGLTVALTVPIEVVVQSTPTLALCKGSEALTIQRVRCWGIDCWLSKALEPKAFLGSQSICLENSSREPFTIGASVQGRGVTTQGVLGEGLKVIPLLEVPVQRIINLPVTFGATPIADHYSGTILLTSGNDSLAKVPVDVNVRSGPLGPLLILLLGILLGRLLKYMKDKGGPQSDLLLAMYQIEGQIAASPQDQALLQPMIENLKAQIYDMQLDTAKTELAAIRNRWSLLTTLRGLENTLVPRHNDPAVQAVLTRIQTVRTHIGAEQDQQAATEVAAIQTDVRNLPAAPAVPGAVAMYSLARSQANTAAVIAKSAANQVQPPTILGGPDSWGL